MTTPRCDTGGTSSVSRLAVPHLVLLSAANAQARRFTSR